MNGDDEKNGGAEFTASEKNGGNIERVLAEQGVYMSTTVGVSMWPMLRDRRDTIIIKPNVGRLNKYDVPLYRRGSDYILHRIIRVLPDSYIICGDNCARKEYGITDGQIIGVLNGFYRGEREIDMQGRGYRAYVRFWCAVGPLRRAVYRLRAFAAVIWHKLRRN